MTNPDAVMRFPAAVRHDPRIDGWFAQIGNPHRLMVQPWFDVMRGCGEDVRELIHDGCPVACVGDAAFAYVNAFKAHANVGFFNGAALPDPARLLQGSGKRMRHAKLKPGEVTDEAALNALVAAAYDDMRRRMGASG